MFLFFLNLWSLFFCVLIFLLKNAVFFKKATVSQCCFFPFLSTHSDAFLSCCSWKYICISFWIFFTTKKLLLDGSAPLWPEMPNFVQKRCYLFFFSRFSCIIWFGLFFSHKWQKHTLFWVTNDKNPTQMVNSLIDISWI
jgi:hypothetical protein